MATLSDGSVSGAASPLSRRSENTLQTTECDAAAYASERAVSEATSFIISSKLVDLRKTSKETQVMPTKELNQMSERRENLPRRLPSFKKDTSDRTRRPMMREVVEQVSQAESKVGR